MSKIIEADKQKLINIKDENAELKKVVESLQALDEEANNKNSLQDKSENIKKEIAHTFRKINKITEANPFALNYYNEKLTDDFQEFTKKSLNLNAQNQQLLAEKEKLNNYNEKILNELGKNKAKYYSEEYAVLERKVKILIENNNLRINQIYKELESVLLEEEKIKLKLNNPFNNLDFINSFFKIEEEKNDKHITVITTTEVKKSKTKRKRKKASK